MGKDGRITMNPFKTASAWLDLQLKQDEEEEENMEAVTISRKDELMLLGNFCHGLTQNAVASAGRNLNLTLRDKSKVGC